MTSRDKHYVGAMEWPGPAHTYHCTAALIFGFCACMLTVVAGIGLTGLWVCLLHTRAVNYVSFALHTRLVCQSAIPLACCVRVHRRQHCGR